jgi:glucose-1-phosphate adenylyltransferase
MQGEAHDSIISEGCIISGAQITRSLLFTNVHVNCRSRISDSLILPDTVIGEDCHIKRAIIDKGATIADGSIIGENLSEDAKRFHVSSEGIVLVTPDMLCQPIHYAR